MGHAAWREIGMDESRAWAMEMKNKKREKEDVYALAGFS
jgi:hypothetical protein